MTSPGSLEDFVDSRTMSFCHFLLNLFIGWQSIHLDIEDVLLPLIVCMKYLSICLLFFLLPVYAFSAEVVGRVVDNNDMALDFVNVVLTSKADAAAVYGAITDADGRFAVHNVPAGDYTLAVSFMGYQTVERDVRVGSSDRQVRAGLFVMKEDSQLLSEVEVVGQASQMRFDIDKKVFNVDQNLASSGASATEMLENIPSVEVDNDGNVSLRNSSNVEVWINGKPSGLTEENRAQILEQMPAGSIEAVEVITNPSAKFNPEGTAGVINLVLKKDRKAGYYGSVSAGTSWNVGSVPGANVGANFNYNSKVVDFYANVGFRYRNMRSGSFTDRYSLAPYDGGVDTVSFLNNTSTGKRSFMGVFGRIGADFHLSERNTLSISGMGFGGVNSSLNVNDYFQLAWASMDSTLYTRSNTRDGKHPSYSAALDYVYEIDKKGSEFRTGVEYSGGGRSGDYFYRQTVTGGNAGEYNQIQRQDGEFQRVEYRADYTQKFGTNMKLEAGLFGSWQLRHSPSRTWNEVDGGENLLIQYNDFNYEEWIGAMYATYGAKFGGFSFSAGLRGEYTNTHVATRDDESAAYDVTTRGYWQLYPTAFVAYDFGSGNELQANYTRRIHRPRGRQINSFRNMSDSTNIEFGNPLLHPEISSAVELNYLKTWENHALTASLYYRYSDNVIQSVRYLDEHDVMNTTYENISRRQSAGVELVAKNKVTKWLNLTTTLNGYYTAMDNVYYDTDLDGQPNLLYPHQESFSWSGRIMANFLIPLGFSAQLTAYYRSPNVVAQGRTTHNYSIDLGVRKSFLNRALNLSLSVRDLLNSRRWATTTYGDNFWQYAEHSPHGTMLSLSLSYNFGNQGIGRKKQKQTQSGSMGSDSLDGMEDF